MLRFCVLMDVLFVIVCVCVFVFVLVLVFVFVCVLCLCVCVFVISSEMTNKDAANAIGMCFCDCGMPSYKLDSNTALGSVAVPCI